MMGYESGLGSKGFPEGLISSYELLGPKYGYSPWKEPQGDPPTICGVRVVYVRPEALT